MQQKNNLPLSTSTTEQLKAYQSHPENTIPKGDWIWVFASDRKGKHNKGYAKTAHTRFHAQYGCSHGESGSAYAIQTTKNNDEAVEFLDFQEEMIVFRNYALSKPSNKFYLTSMSPFSTELVAPLIVGLPVNVSIPKVYIDHLVYLGNAFEKSAAAINLDLAK